MSDTERLRRSIRSHKDRDNVRFWVTWGILFVTLGLAITAFFFPLKSSTPAPPPPTPSPASIFFASFNTTATLSGALSGNITINITRIGDTVTVCWPEISGNFSLFSEVILALATGVNSTFQPISGFVWYPFIGFQSSGTTPFFSLAAADQNLGALELRFYHDPTLSTFWPISENGGVMQMCTTFQGG